MVTEMREPSTARVGRRAECDAMLLYGEKLSWPGPDFRQLCQCTALATPHRSDLLYWLAGWEGGGT